MRRRGPRHRPRRLPDRAGVGLLAVALAASGLVACPRPAVAAGGGRAVFLPWLAQPAPLEPCGPVGGDPCATGPSESWVTVCGGLGRVRDMVIPSLPVAGGPFELLAVGDGAAWLTVWPASTPGPPSAVRWQAHVGADLTGINALGLDLEADPRGERGWAVGERDRIFTLLGSCLHREDDYESNGVELTAVNGDTPHGGWIVGRTLALDGDRPRETGVWRIMASPGAPSGPSWQDYRGQITPPPLTDVAFLYNRQFDQAEAWSVGATAGTGVFLYGQEGPSGLWRWTERARAPGAPREITLRSNGAEGWAFGAGTRGGQAGLASWYFLRGAVDWVQDPELFWPGRELVDVYSESRLADERMNVGLSPAGSAPTIVRLDFTTRQWQEIGRPPPGLAPTAGDGSRAIAPDSAGHTVYAWGDDVWLFHEAAATPTPALATAPPAGTGTPAATPNEPGESRETGAWSLLRRSRPLRGFVPIGDGGWAIADAGAGSDLLVLHHQAFQALYHTARRLRALDAASDRIWAVGDGGLTLRFEAGRWRELTGEPPVEGDLLDVAAASDGSAWAAGVGADGRGRVWRWAPAGPGWTEVARTHGATALRAVAGGRVRARIHDAAGVRRGRGRPGVGGRGRLYRPDPRTGGARRDEPALCRRHRASGPGGRGGARAAQRLGGRRLLRLPLERRRLAVSGARPGRR